MIAQRLLHPLHPPIARWSVENSPAEISKAPRPAAMNVSLIGPGAFGGESHHGHGRIEVRVWRMSDNARGDLAVAGQGSFSGSLGMPDVRCNVAARTDNHETFGTMSRQVGPEDGHAI